MVNFSKGNLHEVATHCVPSELLVRMEEELAEHDQHRTLAILVISISRSDHLEAILGMEKAADVHKALVERLKSMLRPADYFAIPSGTEIWVVLSGIGSEDMAKLAAHNLLRTLGMPVANSGEIVAVQPTAGAITVSLSETSSFDLIRAATILAERARSCGSRLLITRHDNTPELPDSVIAAYLKKALADNQLKVVYQPKVFVQTNCLAGLEALIRWDNPPHPSINPQVLVLAAERFGMIEDLSRYVINTTLREYTTIFPDIRDARIWVNISVSMLHNELLPDILEQLVSCWAVNPALLGLEMTESTLLTDVERSIANLHALVAKGFSLAIDDFGTGYSSLAYLRQFPVTELKIDKIFIQNMLQSLPDRQIVRSVIDLARTFELKIVAEGVEDRETLAVLDGMGCEQVQGYVYSKPVPGIDLTSRLDQFGIHYR